MLLTHLVRLGAVCFSISSLQHDIPTVPGVHLMCTPYIFCPHFALIGANCFSFFMYYLLYIYYVLCAMYLLCIKCYVLIIYSILCIYY